MGEGEREREMEREYTLFFLISILARGLIGQNMNSKLLGCIALPIVLGLA